MDDTPREVEILDLRAKSKQQADFERRCRIYADEEGWRKLLVMLRGDNKADFKWAFGYVVAYGFGKPRESLDVTQRGEITISPDELVRQIRQLTAGSPAASPRPDRADEATA